MLKKIGLSFAEKYYLNPLKVLSKTNIVSEEMISKIQTPLIDILNLHFDILNELNSREYSIGQIFSTVTPLFKRYSIYTKIYHEIFEYFTLEMKTNERFNQFIEETQKNNLKKGYNDLFSNLITPIQRLPRYSLLLQELLNETNREEETEEFEMIQHSIKELKSIIHYLNESIRRDIENEKLKSIYNSIDELPKYILFSRFQRKILFQSENEILMNGTLKCRIYLFNDLIIFTNNFKFETYINLMVKKLNF
jgi:hypothetical protein